MAKSVKKKAKNGNLFFLKTFYSKNFTIKNKQIKEKSGNIFILKFLNPFFNITPIL